MKIPQNIRDYILNAERPIAAMVHLRAFDGAKPRLATVDQLMQERIPVSNYTVLSLFEKTGLRIAVFAKSMNGDWLLVQDDMVQ